IDRHAGQRIHTALGFNHILRVAANAVLRAEQRRELEPMREEQVSGVAQLAVDAGRIAKERQTLAGEDASLLDQHALEPGSDQTLAEGHAGGTLSCTGERGNVSTTPCPPLFARPG